MSSISNPDLQPPQAAGRSGPSPAPHEIQVTVEYVGANDYQQSYPPGVTFQAIKVQAMRFFELNPGDADRYALQQDGIDLSDQGHLGDLQQKQVRLTLCVKTDLPKG